MKIQIETITPDMAARYLEHNLVNRRINELKVNAYAHDMKNGAWQLNGEAIRFDSDGRLIDGQHRLKAIIKSGKQIPIVVMRDIANNVTIYDRGRPRNVTDSLIMGGLDKSIANPIYCGVAKLHAKAQLGKSVISDEQVKEFLLHHEGTLQAMRPIWTRSRGLKSGVVPTKTASFLLACMYAIESGEDINKIYRFAQVYSTGLVDNSTESAAVIVRNDYLSKTLSPYAASANDSHRVQALHVYEKAIFDFCRGYRRTKSYKNYSGSTYSNNVIFKSL